MAARQRTASVIFLGCPKNQVDSEHALGSLCRAGYTVTAEPETADLVVITTCAFLRASIRESEAAVSRAIALKKTRPDMTIVVAGCLVQRLGRELPRRFPEVDFWAGLDELTDIPRLLSMRARYFASTRPRALQDARTPRLLSTPGHYAYLKIADGCDNRCSYCTIPDIRGPLRSRPLPDIIAEARNLADSGVKELILIAQDTTAYGLDLYGRSRLAELLRKLSRVDGISWLRLMYAHPAHLTEEIIDQFGANPKLCRYIDLPLQHVSNRLLAAMNRPCTRADIELVIEHLRSVPDMHIRTTLITGFPGETAADFQALLNFIRDSRLDRLSAFAYSAEPGTRAAALRPPVSPAVKNKRLRRLMQLQARISRSNLRKLIGRRLAVIVDKLGQGRTEWDAPDIDGIVKLKGELPKPGSLVQALVTASGAHDITAHTAR